MTYPEWRSPSSAQMLVRLAELVNPKADKMSALQNNLGGRAPTKPRNWPLQFSRCSV